MTRRKTFLVFIVLSLLFFALYVFDFLNRFLDVSNLGAAESVSHGLIYDFFLPVLFPIGIFSFYYGLRWIFASEAALAARASAKTYRWWWIALIPNIFLVKYLAVTLLSPSVVEGAELGALALPFIFAAAVGFCFLTTLAIGFAIKYHKTGLPPKLNKLLMILLSIGFILVATNAVTIVSIGTTSNKLESTFMSFGLGSSLSAFEAFANAHTPPGSTSVDTYNYAYQVHGQDWFTKEAGYQMQDAAEILSHESPTSPFYENPPPVNQITALVDLSQAHAFDIIQEACHQTPTLMFGSDGGVLHTSLADNASFLWLGDTLVYRSFDNGVTQELSPNFASLNSDGTINLCGESFTPADVLGLFSVQAGGVVLALGASEYSDTPGAVYGLTAAQVDTYIAENKYLQTALRTYIKTGSF